MQIPLWQRVTITILDFLIPNWGPHANPTRSAEPLHSTQIYWGAIGLLGIPVAIIVALWDVAFAVYACAPIVAWIAYLYIARIPTGPLARFCLWSVVTFFVGWGAMRTGPYLSKLAASKAPVTSASVPAPQPTAPPKPPDEPKRPDEPKPPVPQPTDEPEVVFFPSIANIVLTWVHGVDMTPRINVAGKSGYPAMELRGLSAKPIVSITINWRAANPNVGQLPSSKHLVDLGARISEGMLWFKDGSGYSVGQTAKTEVPFLTNDPVVVDVPPQIWNAFVLTLISDRERPDRPSETNPGFLRTTATVGDATITYREGGKSFSRKFRMEAVVVTQHDSTLVGGSNVQQVPLDRYSPHNLRANLRLSVSPAEDDYVRPTPQQTQSLYDMFVNDFSHTVRLKDKTTLPVGTEKVELTFQVYYDFGARSKFIGFYIPDSPKTQELSASLAEDVPKIFEAFATKKVEGGQVGQPLLDKDLVFTGIVYIYHLANLTIEARASIKDAFKAKHLEVQFRGPEYFLMRNQGR